MKIRYRISVQQAKAHHFVGRRYTDYQKAQKRAIAEFNKPTNCGAPARIVRIWIERLELVEDVARRGGKLAT